METDRLCLRRYTESDRASFVALNTDAVVRERMNGPLSAAAAEALFDRIRAADEGPDVRAWAMTHRETGAFLGHIFVTREEAARCELGFVLTQASWGQGYASEAARAVAEHVEAMEPGIELFATVDLDHPASARVLEKAGFRYAQTRKDEYGPYGVYVRAVASA